MLNFVEIITWYVVLAGIVYCLVGILR
jgi:hypothetical protein